MLVCGQLNKLIHYLFVFVWDLQIICMLCSVNCFPLIILLATQMSYGFTLKPNFSKVFLNFLQNSKDETIIPHNAFEISKQSSATPFWRGPDSSPRTLLPICFALILFAIVVMNASFMCPGHTYGKSSERREAMKTLRVSGGNHSIALI